MTFFIASLVGSGLVDWEGLQGAPMAMVEGVIAKARMVLTKKWLFINSRPFCRAFLILKGDLPLRQKEVMGLRANSGVSGATHHSEMVKMKRAESGTRPLPVLNYVSVLFYF
jgi:hypothetical protein